MDPEKNPSSEEAIIKRIIKSGGRPLPGMVPSRSILGSGRQSKKKEFTVQESKEDFIEWWFSEEPWKELEHLNAEKDGAEALAKKAENLKKALYVYAFLLREQGPILQALIEELEEVAKNTGTDVKIACVTGGTVVLGLVAAIGSAVYAPSTRWASLAVGVGVVAFSAVIYNRVNSNDRKMAKIIFEDYYTQIEEIERCLKYISTIVRCLKKCDLKTLTVVDRKAEKIVEMAQHVTDSTEVISAVSKCSGLTQGIVLGMDMCFCKDDNKQLKQSQTTFSMQINKLAKQMQANLDELMMCKTVVECADM